jgi:hypothetical protein
MPPPLSAINLISKGGAAITKAVFTQRWPMFPGLAPHGNNESSLYPEMANVSGIGATQNARKSADVFCRKNNANHAHAIAQKTIHRFREVREFIDQKDVDFSALVLVNVLFVFAVA